MSAISTRKTVLIAAFGMAATFAAGYAIADQPHMDAALKDLQTAKGELTQAKADKGGHREKALSFLDQAIGETQEGIKFANQN